MGHPTQWQILKMIDQYLMKKIIQRLEINLITNFGFTLNAKDLSFVVQKKVSKKRIKKQNKIVIRIVFTVVNTQFNQLDTDLDMRE